MNGDETKRKRRKLSVDLDSYPDVRDALALVCEKPGFNATQVTIEALRDWLSQPHTYSTPAALTSTETGSQGKRKQRVA